VPSNLLQSYKQDENWIDCIGSEYVDNVFVAIQ
jgi:hypothetical protein